MKKTNKGYGFPLRQESFPIPEEIVRAEYDEFLDHFQHLMNLKMKDDMMTVEERTSPDTYGCDCVFLDTFVTPAMEWEFALIARDFLMHEFENSKQHEMVQYLGTDCGDHWPEKLFERYILNMMMNAVNFGSSYSKNLFLYLHKVYYKKEYRQLKRFNRLSSGELIALAESERGTSPSAMARILTIARMQGIDIGPDCNFVYLYLNDYNEKRQEDDGYNWDLMDTTREIYDECLEEIRQMFDEDEMHSMYFKCGEFLGNALLSQGYVDDYIMLCNEDDRGVEDRLAKTLAVLKKTYKKRKEYTKEELIFYAQAYEVIGALTSNASDMDTILMDVLYGEKQLTNPEEYHFTFRPDEIPQGRGALSNVQKEKDEKNTAKTELRESPRYKEETYYKYINVIRERDVEFGYIHGVNIENTVRKLYNELKK